MRARVALAAAHGEYLWDSLLEAGRRLLPRGYRDFALQLAIWLGFALWFPRKATSDVAGALSPAAAR